MPPASLGDHSPGRLLGAGCPARRGRGGAPGGRRRGQRGGTAGKAGRRGPALELGGWTGRGGVPRGTLTGEGGGSGPPPLRATRPKTGGGDCARHQEGAQLRPDDARSRSRVSCPESPAALEGTPMSPAGSELGAPRPPLRPGPLRGRRSQESSLYLCGTDRNAWPAGRTWTERPCLEPGAGRRALVWRLSLPTVRSPEARSSRRDDDDWARPGVGDSQTPARQDGQVRHLGRWQYFGASVMSPVI
ncbi:protein FAM117B-like [Hylobates moloch]|uniref:protein FAM117B-like n=1 Tax=Hylobates moloch TaxID=81572 RepID=UPI0013622567|nr:protein FAM117B-like [Hylobates moloch]